MFKSVRNQLFVAFLTISIFGIGIGLSGFYYFNKIEEIYQLTKLTNNLFSNYLKIIQSEYDFLTKESISSDFFNTGKSTFLSTHEEYIILASEDLDQIEKNQALNEFGINKEIEIIKNEFYYYDSTFRKIVNLIKERGFKDHGAEGKMRIFAHEIENYGDLIDQKNLLSLRRYEKDYIMRRDSIYLEALEIESKKLSDHFLENSRLSHSQVLELQSLFFGYQQAFKEILKIDQQLGLTKSKGLNDEKDSHKLKLEELFKRINVACEKNEQKIINQLYSQFAFTVGIFFIISLILSSYISKLITKPITNLTKFIKDELNNDFVTDKRLQTSSTNEHGLLIQNFNSLLDKVEVNLKEISDKNSILKVQFDKLQKSEQELSKLNSMKDKFFAIISHDLRSPINSMTGFTKLLHNFADKMSPAELREFASNMDSNLANVKDLLDNLLQWARSQTGGLILNPEEVDIESLVIENIKLLQNTANLKHISLKYAVLPKTVIYADKHILNFMLRNLISNAIKFTPKHGLVEIRVIIGSYANVILVKDNGIGIKSENVYKLFDFNTHYSTVGTNKEKGTGLGLLLCKDFADKSNATITVESEEGQGTSFYVSFPHKKSDRVPA